LGCGGREGLIFLSILSSFTILRDTREQKGWSFPGSQLKDVTLKTGDYTLEGFENQIVIERKGSTGELAKNVIETRFQKEIERLAEIPHSYIFLEFSRSDLDLYPRGTNIPLFIQKKIRVKAPLMLKKIETYLLKYNIQTFFCGDPILAEEMAYSILSGFYFNGHHTL
jgi:hypothetical protein